MKTLNGITPVIARALLGDVASAGVFPSAWSIETGVETTAGATPLSDFDAAMLFGGLTSSSVDNSVEHPGGPGFWFSEGNVDASLSVLIVPAPMSALPLAGVALLMRRRR